MTQNKFTTNNNPTLVAVSNADGETPVYLYADPATHGLVVSATISSVGLATSSNQTDGSQKTQIVDAGGEAATVTGGKLDVNATASLAGSSLPISGAATGVGVAILDSSGNQISSFGGGTQYVEDTASAGGETGTVALGVRRDADTSPVSADGDFHTPIYDNAGAQKVNVKTSALPTGAATAARQDTGNTSLSSIDGKITAVNTGAVVISSGSVTANAGTNLNTSALALAATQTDKSQFTKLTDGTDTALITAAGEQNVIATAQPGVDIGDVTINNATGGAAVNIQDGGNSITVDGSVTVTQGTGSNLHTVIDSGTVSTITNVVHVDDNSGSLTVDNGGTFAVQATIASGATSIAKAEDVASADGDVGVPALAVRKATPANTSGTDGDYEFLQMSTGRLWVDASGKTLTVDGSGVTQPISGTVAGTGNFIVVQATASNLNATVVGTGTFVVQATLVAETTKVIGTVNQGTSPWVTSNATTSVVGNGAAATAQRVTLANDSTGIIATVGAVTAITNALPVGANVIGKVSIDQTTPGTTNLVALAANQSVNNTQVAGTTIDVNSGSKSAGTIRVVLATDQPSLTNKLLVTPDSVALPANQSVNISQINGVTPLMGNGATGTGSQRVTIASDNTAFSVNATLSAETTKVIGTVNIAASQTIAVTNAGTFATQPTIQTGTNSIGKISDITTSVTPGTAAANLGKAEDAAAASGDTGVMALGVRNDSLTATQTNANGDYGALSIDTSGILIIAGAPRLLKGRQVTTITSSTAETTILTSVASTFLDIYGLILTNTSATVTKVSVRDATAGGTITVLEVPPTDTRGFMLPLDSAIPQAAVTNNWTAQCGTSVASLEVTVLYVKRV